MRCGTVCYATSRGLGHLAHDFYKHGLVTDVCVIRHSGVPTNKDWYPGAPITDIRNMDRGLLRDFCKGKDAMLFFETPFAWDLITYCREIGVRTYIITMYECTPTTHPRPHKYLCPSLLDMQYFPDGVFLPLPVEYPWRLRTRAEWFIHNGGYLGLRGREGTTLLIEAMAYVKSPIRLTIRVQENVPTKYQARLAVDKRCEYIAETVPYHDLYGSGDVVVQPQKFNGCSLPLQEARASGMLVMTTDRFPMNTWLPRESLIPVSGYSKERIGGGYLEFDEAQISPLDIAATIDLWFGRDITAYSETAKAWAEIMSWERLLPLYREVLAS